MDSSQYDVFVSYKSDNAEVVRDVVEILRANGVRTWFAEHSISLQDWLVADDPWIDTTLENAVKQSRHVIVFSSKPWHDSPWCRDEYEHAHGGVVNHEAITILKLEECDEDRHLSVGVTFPHRPETIPATCLFLSSRLGCEIKMPKGPSPEGSTAVISRGRFAVSLLCNPLKSFNLILVRGLTGSIEGAFVRCAIYFKPSRTTATPDGKTREELDLSVKELLGNQYRENQSSDRNIYREYAARAAQASLASGTDVFGLHLMKARHSFPDLDGGVVSNNLSDKFGFAISKIKQTDSSRFAIGRDYCFRLDNGPGNPVGEIMIAFETYVKGCDKEAAQYHLSRISPYLDRVAASVRYHRTGLPLARSLFVFRSAISGIFFLGVSVGIVSGFQMAERFSFIWFSYVLLFFLAFLSTAITGARLLSRYLPTAPIHIQRQR